MKEDIFCLDEAKSYIMNRKKWILEVIDVEDTTQLLPYMDRLKGEYEKCDKTNAVDRRRASVFAWCLIRLYFRHQRSKCIEWIENAANLGLESARYLRRNPPPRLLKFLGKSKEGCKPP